MANLNKQTEMDEIISKIEVSKLRFLFSFLFFGILGIIAFLEFTIGKETTNGTILGIGSIGGVLLMLYIYLHRDAYATVIYANGIKLPSKKLLGKKEGKHISYNEIRRIYRQTHGLNVGLLVIEDVKGNKHLITDGNTLLPYLKRGLKERWEEVYKYQGGDV